MCLHLVAEDIMMVFVSCRTRTCRTRTRAHRHTDQVSAKLCLKWRNVHKIQEVSLYFGDTMRQDGLHALAVLLTNEKLIDLLAAKGLIQCSS